MARLPRPDLAGIPPKKAKKGVREHFRLKRTAAWGAWQEKFSDPFLISGPTVLA